MMAEKARLFRDEENRQRAIAAKSPGEAKAIGRLVTNFNEAAWTKKRFDIVVVGNLHKFSQNEALKQYLLGTQSRVLVEASPVDKIWGIGLAADNPNCENPRMWQGPNLLGFALMEVRSRLQGLDDDKND